MKDRRPVYISIAVILVLLLVVLPAGAADVGKGSSPAQGTAASSAEAGSGTETSAVAPPDQTPQPADKEMTARGVSPVPTTSTKPTTTETKAVVVTTAAPALGSTRPGNSGSGDDTVRAGDATTLPTATPSVDPSAGSGAGTEGNEPGKTAGGTASISGRTAVPTATPTTSGSTQSRTGGDGAGQGGPGGKEATATPTTGAKAGSTAKGAPTDAPTVARTSAGSGSAGAGQSPQTVDVAANGSGATVGTGRLLAGGNGAGQAVSDPAEASAAGTRAAENGESPGGIDTDRGPGPGSPGAAAGPAGGVTCRPTTGCAGQGSPEPAILPGVTGYHSCGQVHRTGVSSARGGLLPTVSSSPFNLYAARPGAEAGAARAVRSGDAGHDGTRGDPRPQNAGREKGAPALPAAAPVRTGLEPLSQGPGESGGGRGRRRASGAPPSGRDG